MALSAASLEEVIKPDMQQRYQMEKKNCLLPVPQKIGPKNVPDFFGNRTSMYFSFVTLLVFLLTPLQLNLSSTPKQK
jgi:hypothetical protein